MPKGIITGLWDNAGTEVVTYSYDSWGKVISTTGPLASTVGEKNPYKYRGYRYDTETGFYYLQSRYYNPEWGRFINADAYGGKVGNLLSHNVFAYALNNPVNMSDASGFMPTWAKWAIGIAAAAVAVVVAIVALPAEVVAAVTTAVVTAANAVATVVSRVGQAAQNIAQRAAPTVTRASQAVTKGAGKSANAQVKHIFRDAPGHLTDTPVNRTLLETTANNSKNFLGVDKHGASWYAQIQSDGSQAWVKTYNGTISNGGVNQVPIKFDPATGLNQNPFAK